MFHCLKIAVCLALFSVVASERVILKKLGRGNEKCEIQLDTYQLPPGFRNHYVIYCSGACGKFDIEFQGTGQPYLFGHPGQQPQVGDGHLSSKCLNVIDCSCIIHKTKSQNVCKENIETDRYFFTVMAYDIGASVNVSVTGEHIESVTQVTYNCNCVHGQCRRKDDVHVCVCEFGWGGQKCNEVSKPHRVKIGQVLGGVRRTLLVKCEKCFNVHIELEGPENTKLFAHPDETPDIGVGIDYDECKNDIECICDNKDGKRQTTCTVLLPKNDQFYVTVAVSGKASANISLLFSGKSFKRATLIQNACNPDCFHGHCVSTNLGAFCQCKHGWGGFGCIFKLEKSELNMVLPPETKTDVFINCLYECGVMDVKLQTTGIASLFGNRHDRPVVSKESPYVCQNDCFCQRKFTSLNEPGCKTEEFYVTYFFSVQTHDAGANVTLEFFGKHMVNIFQLK